MEVFSEDFHYYLGYHFSLDSFTSRCEKTLKSNNKFLVSAVGTNVNEYSHK